MFTWQDIASVGESDDDRTQFVISVINDHKSSDLYREAVIADEYDRKRNTTIREYQKLLYTVSGNAVPDNWSANFKVARAFFPFFITQENQYLLGNGVTWDNTATEDKLGTEDQPFDTQLQDAGHKALIGGVSFGFYNLDHLEVFGVNEFAPLFDEENGSLRAGVRFWQLDDLKPLRATFYEEDGYTDFIWRRNRKDEVYGEVLNQKRPYKWITQTTGVDGTEIIDGMNYPNFPIVPLWGNKAHQSELTGLREQIDCYDLIKSGFANTVDEASYMYWALENAGGMDDIDLTKFVERVKTIHAAVLEDEGTKAESHQLEAPYQSREALLSRLERDIFKDAMALDIENIAAGANTATQIRAAYEPLNSKCDGYEYCVNQFVKSILKLAGVDDKPTFTRSMIVNAQESIQTLLQAAQYLPEEYVTEKILTILGDGDRVDEILNNMEEEELNMGGVIQTDQNYDMNVNPIMQSPISPEEYTE